MLPTRTIHAESARYSAPLILVHGLWVGPDVWQAAAGFLAPRGWECHLVDLREQVGGLAARGAALAELIQEIGQPPVIVGHDAGGLVALAAAEHVALRATLLVAPLVPRGGGLRAAVLQPRHLLGLAMGWAVPPPAAISWSESPPVPAALAAAELHPEPAAVLLDIARGRWRVPPSSTRGSVCVLAGGCDAIVAPGEAQGFARHLGAEFRLLAGRGHWPQLGPGWEPTMGMLHRWIVQRLGEQLLEFYPEAMAERDAEDDSSD